MKLHGLSIGIDIGDLEWPWTAYSPILLYSSQPSYSASPEVARMVTVAHPACTSHPNHPRSCKTARDWSYVVRLRYIRPVCTTARPEPSIDGSERDRLRILTAHIPLEHARKPLRDFSIARCPRRDRDDCYD